MKSKNLVRQLGEEHEHGPEHKKSNSPCEGIETSRDPLTITGIEFILLSGDRHIREEDRLDDPAAYEGVKRALGALGVSAWVAPDQELDGGLSTVIIDPNKGICGLFIRWADEETLAIFLAGLASRIWEQGHAEGEKAARREMRTALGI
jgi:hypothetical protein